MIFFAVTAPTPGSASRSFWLAVFTSTIPEAAGPAERAGAEAFAGAGGAAAAEAGDAPFGDAAGAAVSFAAFVSLAAATLPALTWLEIFWIVASGTPARARSATDE